VTWTMSSGVRSKIRKIAVAGLLFAAPAAVVGGPASAALAATPNPPVVVPAPLPADPPQPAPPPPPAQQSQGEYYTPNDQDDWWVYAGTGSF
jgi:hypothetical protein